MLSRLTLTWVMTMSTVNTTSTINTTSSVNNTSRRPIEELATALAHYASLGHDVRHFSALWHTFNVGHMLVTNLNRICREYDLSSADLNLLGALGVDQDKPLRASDLAITLQVSNAALSSRIDKLARKGLLIRSPDSADRRSFTLLITPQGAQTVESAHAAITRDAHFVREFHRLSAEDQAALNRIMGTLHAELDRDFTHVHR